MKSRNPESFIKQPYFKGGQPAMDALIKRELKYPQEALDHNIEGTVSVRYDIDHRGRVVKAKVLQGIGHGCDEEAIRLIRLFKFVVPKNPKGVKLTFHKTTLIHFRLPGKAKQAPRASIPHFQAPSQVVYELKPAEKPAPSYTYTIQIPEQ